MSKTEKILILHNEIEARLLEDILKERGIPCLLRSFHDSAYDGMWQTQSGWGRLDSYPEHREEILRIYAEISEKQNYEDKDLQE